MDNCPSSFKERPSGPAPTQTIYRMNFTADGRADNQNRLIGLAFVVGFHILLVWGLVNGLARKAIELLPEPIETKIIEDVKPKMEEPPPPVPEFEPPPPPYIPPPDIVIAPPPEPPKTITQITEVKPETLPPPPAPPMPPRESVRVAPKIDYDGSPRGCRKPNYPAASQRLEEQGTSRIRLLINVAGKVAESGVEKSSGYPRLDEAAIRAFSTCKFTVGTVDGKPEPTWFRINYKWSLEDE